MSESELRVTKIPLAVEVAPVGQESRSVSLFVAEHLADQYRPQHLRDLLESEGPFIPAQEADESWSILNKESLLWASVALADGELPVEETDPDRDAGSAALLYDQRFAVSVDLRSGTLDGELLFTPPPGRSRVVDYLNQDGRFFPLWTATRLYCINKGHVVRVREVGE